MQLPPVSVIILNYNGREYLEACLSAVLAQGYPSFEVILVDNASADGSVELVAERFPSVRIVRNEANLGFAGGNNRGVSEARFRWIVLLNNDTRVEARWLEELVRGAACESDSGKPGAVGAASSLVRTEGVPDRYYERNGSLSLAGYNVMRVFHSPTELFYANGCSCLLDKDLLGEPFDPDYFLYAEDVYLGFRVRFAGREIRHVPGSLVRHLGSASTRRMPGARVTFYQERNRLLNLALFFTPWTQTRIAPYVGLNCAAKLLVAAVGRGYSLRGLLRAYLWFPTHAGTIWRKRRALRAERKVGDAEVLRYMSSKVTHGDGVSGRLINVISRLYCRLVGLRTYETGRDRV